MGVVTKTVSFVLRLATYRSFSYCNTENFTSFTSFTSFYKFPNAWWTSSRASLVYFLFSFFDIFLAMKCLQNVCSFLSNAGSYAVTRTHGSQNCTGHKDFTVKCAYESCYVLLL